MSQLLVLALSPSLSYTLTHSCMENASTSIVIEKGGIRDRDAIASFQVSMAMESEGLRLDHGTVLRGVEMALTDASKGTYYVARLQDGIILGSLLVTKEWSDWNATDYWWIQSVYVRPEYRGKGVFRSLYAKVRQEALKAGSPYLRLYADRGNVKAQKLYERLGMARCHYLMFEEKL